MKIDVCICTFRRLSIIDTLESISRQQLPQNVKLAVIVADNDEKNINEAEILAQGTRLNLKIQYVFAPKFNISIARNACLSAATGDLIAFIDDDEVAEPTWLNNLISAHKSTEAGVIFGPALAIYPEHAPSWMTGNDLHSNLPTSRNGVVETGFSSNVLIDRGIPALRDLRFDLAYGRTGGEDVDYFFRVHRANIPMAICHDAIVREPVAPSRMSFKWLARRRHTYGVIYGHCSLEGLGGMQRIGVVMKSGVKCGFCLLRSAFSIASKKNAAFWFLRGAFHAGVISGAKSPPSREAYGAPTSA